MPDSSGEHMHAAFGNVAVWLGSSGLKRRELGELERWASILWILAFCFCNVRRLE